MLHKTKVEESNSTFSVEDVVARVRVAVERGEPVDRPERKPKESFSREVALFLRPFEHLSKLRADHKLGRQHPLGRVVGEHGRHMNERVIGELVGEVLLVLGLKLVVQLLAQPVAELVGDRCGIDAREHHAKRREERVVCAQVRFDRVGNPRVLDLDGYRIAIVGERSMDLTDRRGCDRRRVPFGEEVARVTTKLLDDHRRSQLARHGRSVGLE